MKIYELNGIKYRLPNNLTDFQLKTYVHLINWKWANLTREPGFFKGFSYDALLPDELKIQLFPLYLPIKEKFLNHQKKFPFKFHIFLGYSMASSQAACATLFLPILKNPDVAVKVLSKVKTDIKKIATEFLDTGFRIEFWDEPDNMLNDHNNASGTDSDIAIAYYDHHNNLNLWLIEHKLAEEKFTPRGGFKSKGRATSHVCYTASAVIENPDNCYYHSGCKYNYWNITLGSISPFNINCIKEYSICPFRRGLNQLWRNARVRTSAA